MDPATAALNLATEVVKLINKIYDDTPPEEREANLRRWYDFLDKLDALFDGPTNGGG